MAGKKCDYSTIENPNVSKAPETSENPNVSKAPETSENPNASKAPETIDAKLTVVTQPQLVKVEEEASAVLKVETSDADVSIKGTPAVAVVSEANAVTAGGVKVEAKQITVPLKAENAGSATVTVSVVVEKGQLTKTLTEKFEFDIRDARVDIINKAVTPTLVKVGNSGVASFVVSGAGVTVISGSAVSGAAVRAGEVSITGNTVSVPVKAVKVCEKDTVKVTVRVSIDGKESDVVETFEFGPIIAPAVSVVITGSGVTVSGSSVKAAIEDEFDLSLVQVLVDGVAVTGSAIKSVKWEPSDKDMLTVVGSGCTAKGTALKNGKVTVTATITTEDEVTGTGEYQIEITPYYLDLSSSASYIQENLTAVYNPATKSLEVTAPGGYTALIPQTPNHKGYDYMKITYTGTCTKELWTYMRDEDYGVVQGTQEHDLGNSGHLSLKETESSCTFYAAQMGNGQGVTGLKLLFPNVAGTMSIKSIELGYLPKFESVDLSKISGIDGGVTYSDGKLVMNEMKKCILDLGLGENKLAKGESILFRITCDLTTTDDNHGLRFYYVRGDVDSGLTAADDRWYSGISGAYPATAAKNLGMIKSGAGKTTRVFELKYSDGDNNGADGLMMKPSNTPSISGTIYSLEMCKIVE